MKKLMIYLKPYKKESIIAPLFKLLEALFDLTVPLAMAYLIDEGILQSQRTVVWKCGLILITLAVTGMAFSFVAQFFAAKAATGATADIRKELFAHIQTFTYSQLDMSGTDSLINRLTIDMNQIQNGINMALRLLLRSPFIVFGAMAMAFCVDRVSGSIFASMIALLSIIVVLIMKRTTAGNRQIKKKMDTLTGLTVENLTGVRVLRAFNRQQAETDNFSKQNTELTELQAKVGRLDSSVNPVTNLLVNVVLILILYTGKIRVDFGVLTGGQVVALVNYLSQILIELVKFANLIVTISKALASADRVSAVLGQQTESEPDAEGHKDNSSILLRLKKVSMRYQNSENDTLTDISFELGIGETLGIIGGTGSGKTSLIELIPGFYKPSGGSLYWKGTEYGKLNMKKTRESISVVSQKTFLLNDTIRENLLMGNRQATDDELLQALDAACALGFVNEKKERMNETVMQNGSNFSGGQKQRLSIARALVRKPSLLILDDATSALDYRTERKLLENLQHLSFKPAVIIVSQRLNSVKAADRILVLDNGKCVGLGSHMDLLKNCQIYREIVESQVAGEKVDS